MSYVHDEIQGQEQKRIPQSIVRARFSNDDFLQLFWNVLVRKFALDNRVGQDRIRRRDTCANSQRLKEVDVRYHRKDQ